MLSLAEALDWRRRVLFCAQLLMLALIAGCASKDPSPTVPVVEPPPPAIPQEVSVQRRSQLHTELAAGYYERGQMDVALEELKEASALDPNNAKTYNVYGLVYAVLGEQQKAEESFKKALALAPQDAEIRQNWGWYLCTHDRPRDSIAEFEAAVRNPLYKTPDIPLVNAARCSALIGDAKAAESYYQRALRVAPGNEAAIYGLALLAYRSGRYEEARRWLKSSRQSTPSAEELYLGMCTERRLGDGKAENSYAVQLRNRYPDSAEVKALGPGSCE